ncbi:hypothetical protein RSAG8_05696, partial [Rhizoctonia solani AG-8 WAC10335]
MQTEGALRQPYDRGGQCRLVACVDFMASIGTIDRVRWRKQKGTRTTDRTQPNTKSRPSA